MRNPVFILAFIFNCFSDSHVQTLTSFSMWGKKRHESVQNGFFLKKQTKKKPKKNQISKMLFDIRSWETMEQII